MWKGDRYIHPILPTCTRQQQSNSRTKYVVVTQTKVQNKAKNMWLSSLFYFRNFLLVTLQRKLPANSLPNSCLLFVFIYILDSFHYDVICLFCILICYTLHTCTLYLGTYTHSTWLVFMFAFSVSLINIKSRSVLRCSSLL